MCVVVTVGYRLAPDYPYPTPVEDALDALKWVYSETGRQTLEIDHRRIAIGGTSAYVTPLPLNGSTG
jgi:acetyl esterase/lipase